MEVVAKSMVVVVALLVRQEVFGQGLVATVSLVPCTTVLTPEAPLLSFPTVIPGTASPMSLESQISVPPLTHTLLYPLLALPLLLHGTPTPQFPLLSALGQPGSLPTPAPPLDTSRAKI